MNAKETRAGEAERYLCVLFGDVSGSTRLYEKLGDKEALHAVERCLNRMTRATEQFKGRVVKTIGDEVMAVFDSAEAGMEAACSMQQRVGDLPPVRGIKLAIRVGFHFGPAIEEATDVFGDTVNMAARMAGLAKAGQIITTAETVGEQVEVDEDGVILGKSENNGGLPRLAWPEISNWPIEKPVPENVRRAAAITSLAGERFQLQGIPSIDSGSSAGSLMVMKLKSGEKIFLSLAKDPVEQLGMLQVVLREVRIGGKPVIEIDMRFENPVVR